MKNGLFPEMGKHGAGTREEISPVSRHLQDAWREPAQLCKLLCPWVPKVPLLSFSVLLDLFQPQHSSPASVLFEAAGRSILPLISAYAQYSVSCAAADQETQSESRQNPAWPCPALHCPASLPPLGPGAYVLSVTF